MSRIVVRQRGSVEHVLLPTELLRVYDTSACQENQKRIVLLLMVPFHAKESAGTTSTGSVDTPFGKDAMTMITVLVWDLRNPPADRVL